MACAARLPPARTAKAAWEDRVEQAFWHEDVARAPGGGSPARVEELLRWFDDAAMIAAYNGRAFDMRVLKRHYGGDEARWAAHVKKLVDPLEAVQRAAGRRLRMDTVLKANGLGQKSGNGADAPEMWRQGRWTQLERYCARDVQALADLVLRPTLRLPGKATTSDAYVGEALDIPTAPATVIGGKRKAAEGGDATSKRKRTGPPMGYMERGGRRAETRKRGAMAMGAITVTRIVRGRYEWRDVAYPATTDKAFWDG